MITVNQMIAALTKLRDVNGIDGDTPLAMTIPSYVGQRSGTTYLEAGWPTVVQLGSDEAFHLRRWSNAVPMIHRGEFVAIEDWTP